MVGFSAFWDPKRMGEDVDTFKSVFLASMAYELMSA